MESLCVELTQPLSQTTTKKFLDFSSHWLHLVDINSHLQLYPTLVSSLWCRHFQLLPSRRNYFLSAVYRALQRFYEDVNHSLELTFHGLFY